MFRESDNLKRFQDSIVTDIKAKAVASARWKVRAMKGNMILRETPWMKNVIVNRWWDSLATTLGSLGFKGFIAGAGTATPAVTDTALQSYLGGGNAFQSASTVINSTVAPRSMTTSVTIRGAEGAVVGNVAELALYWGSTGGTQAPSNTVSICNRVRVTDELGAPTTIQVQADEFLEITCEMTWFAIDGATGVWQMMDKGVLKTFNYEIRPVSMNSNAWKTIGINSSVVPFNPSSYISTASTSSYNSPKALAQTTFVNPSATGASNTEAPGWNVASNAFDSNQLLEAYVPGSRTTKQRIRLPLNNGNLAAPGIRSIMIPFGDTSANSCWCVHQMLLDGPFVKTSNELLDMPITVVRDNA
ncbi:hypothetical protein [Stenotrophomonas sp.]|uniref:hypothetical protein n=1 Tax=Stenotrophomonas sp. TaxID=69392 RepID=UPI0028AE9598|nr:hypothetical protein [Stenotrophomonas sp.]